MQLVPSGEFRAQSLCDLDAAEEVFDLVLRTEVLEHVRDPETAVEVLARLCAHSGSVVITVPDGARTADKDTEISGPKAELESFLRQFGEVEVSRGTDEISLLEVVRP